MKNFKKIHLIFGFTALITFLLTGQYMHHKYNHLIDMPLTERALFRAGHIYILLCSLIHIVIGTYLKISNLKLNKTLQIVGSIFLFISTFILIYSFFTELPTNQIERLFSRFGIYFALAGTLFHSASNFLKNKNKI